MTRVTANIKDLNDIFLDVKVIQYFAHSHSVHFSDFYSIVTSVLFFWVFIAEVMFTLYIRQML